jgi:hypothetical protein
VVPGQQDWVPAGVDISVPSIARVYDFLLGGGHNFAADREMGEQVERAMSGARQGARVNRAFLGRVVRFMMAQGIRQFLDIGSGIPTVSNVHEVAQRVDPRCRVVYVDRDPIAVAHSELMLADNEYAAVVKADIRDPESILTSAPVRDLLDLDQPIGLLMLLMLHWLPDEADPQGLLARYRAALASGSYLAITHGLADTNVDDLTDASEVFERDKRVDQLTLRSHAQITAMFGDFELVEPGLVGCAMWRPGGPADITDDADMNEVVYAGVGRKP